MKIYNILYIIPLLFAITACEKENDTGTESPLDGLTKLSEGYAIGASAKVEIWGKENYFAGYNNLSVVLYDSLDLSRKITDAHITFEPMMYMDMGMMTHTHATPVENPGQEATEGVFKGAIVFIMPTSDAGDWKLVVNIDNHNNGKNGEAEFDITVDSPEESRVVSFISDNPVVDTFFVSLVQPKDPQVGINDFEVAVFSRNGAMDYPEVEDLSITIEPEMPSMGHGSPNNENPVHQDNGHYMGKVNFTMTGWWKVNLTIQDGEDIMTDNISFDITF